MTNEKIIGLEQELAKSKSISMELLQKLKDLEFKLKESNDLNE